MTSPSFRNSGVPRDERGPVTPDVKENLRRCVMKGSRRSRTSRNTNVLGNSHQTGVRDQSAHHTQKENASCPQEPPPPRGPRAPWPALSVPTARAPLASLWFPVLTDTGYALPVKHKGNCFCIEAGGPQGIKPVMTSGREAMVSVRRLDLN